MRQNIPYRRLPGTLERSTLGCCGAFAPLALGQLNPTSAAVGLASTAVNTWLNQIQLAHDADTATTQIVNGLAPLLQANVNAYLAGPGSCNDQAAALSAYLTAVQWLISAKGCGNGSYGSAGNRCISDRFGPNGPLDTNAKYPWASYYYAPIANDPRAAACAAAIAAANPEAGEESAVQNILNAISGGVQTTAGQFATPPGSASTTTSTTGTVSIAGLSIPTEYLLIGGAALVLLLLVTE